MGLERLTERVCYYPHKTDTDRPLLAYIKGAKYTLAVDAGNSAAHVDEFYAALEAEGLHTPDFTAITHWHWDHTFGMHHIAGISIAHKNTNAHLLCEREKQSKTVYTDELKLQNEFIAREYSPNKEIIVVPADIDFAGSLTINLGGLSALLYHVEAPHTDDTVLIYIPEEKVLFLGDATSEDYDRNGYMDKAKLGSLINEIEKVECRYCVLSHAEPLEKRDLLDYLYAL
ncbi:MAG: MBL fold metallo-hydrolase [Oscillospiraceae bacterium]|nr:MBL fold metallo-hydrolase [Oscillospiraceae bacterium]